MGVLRYRARYKIFTGFRAGLAGLFLSLFGIRWVYDLVECKWKLCSDNWEGLKRILVPLIHAMEVLMIKRAGSVLAAIPSAYKYAKNIREDRIYFAPNGRDELLFDPSRYNRTSLRRRYGVSFPLAIYVGKLTPMYAKFLGPAIDAMSIVNKEIPDAELWIYGDGPSKGELERSAKERGGNVRFKGYIDHNRVPEVVAIADVGVHAYDGESLKMVEWLSMGLPTIVPSSLRFDGTIPCRWDAEHIAKRFIEFLRRPERKVCEMPSWKETTMVITKVLKY
ncbi:MAG: hypothetical protein Metus_1094 [Candidatus Methanosuratincola subterraneus]|uniref:Glycosyltransferase n=1 Tax=Methanosuratincola subterraneus TaxID=2593994 RepID=A0A3S3RZL2_METS7|nr:MAG: hypothetical protein Metus_1094 [Candidatus Methanosuratincola subterraneus]